MASSTRQDYLPFDLIDSWTTDDALEQQLKPATGDHLCILSLQLGHKASHTLLVDMWMLTPLHKGQFSDVLRPEIN